MKKIKAKAKSSVKLINKNDAKTKLKKDSERVVKLFDERGVYLHFNDREKKVLFDKYTIYYGSKLSAIQTLEEVFINMAYYFQTDETSPFIIDAGSEVGVATVFFKIFYPKSKILCFEAHPGAFKLLKKNIKVNKLSNVTAVSAALTNKEGVIDFFGEFSSIAEDLDTRGSSIIEEWGLQRETSSTVQVDAVKLSKYIKHKVDYLKLNVEGAEQQILEDLTAKNKMKFIDRLLIKFHHSLKTQDVNNLELVYTLLSKSSFVIKNRIQKRPEQIFPDITKGWAADNEVCLYTLVTEKNKRKTAGRFENTTIELQKKIFLLRKALLEKESFLLRSIINNVPSSIYWKDKDGNYLGHSAYAVEQLRSTNISPNATIKNIIGKSDHDIFTKEIADKYRENDLNVMKNKKNLVIEESVITPNGEELVQLSSKKPLCNEKGEVIGIIGSTIDITDRKRTEQLQKEKAVVEKMSQALEVLSGCIAHEIRTPLSVISINTDNLQAELTKPLMDSSKKEQQSKIKEYINNIKFSIKNGSTIIDMLLVKLRGILNKQDLSHKFILRSIKSGINYVLDVYPFYDNERELVVWDDEANEDFDYFGDEIWTSHVLFNLMKNAIRIIKEEERGKIYISLKRGAKFNYLIFKDTAIGIPDEIFSTLFTQFNNGTRGGAGLGLTFCKMVMQSYGGDITCDSKYGEYTEFTLSFPVRQK